MQFDLATLPVKDGYKLLVSTVVPRPIAWIVTQSGEGRVNAAPYSFFNVVSDEPPLVAIGIGGKDAGGYKDTAANIRANGEFVVCLVDQSTAAAMVVTAIDFDNDVDEVKEAGLTTAPSLKVKPPRIAESPVALECELFQTIELPNDRNLVLGRVVAITVDDRAVLDAGRCYIDTPKLDLIGRMHGGGCIAARPTRSRFRASHSRATRSSTSSRHAPAQAACSQVGGAAVGRAVALGDR